MDNISEAIKKFYADKNDQNFGAVMNLLLNARFIAPASVKPEDADKLKTDENGYIIPEPNMQIALVNITLKEPSGAQKNFLPLFTTAEEAKKGPDARFIQLGLKQYANALNDDNIEGLLINPFGTRFVINKQLLGQVMESYKRADSIRAVNAVKTAFAKFPYVKSAYLLDAVNNETKQKGQLIAADMDDGVTREQMNEAFNAAHTAVQRVVPGYDLKYAPFTAGENIRNAAKGSKPIYVKGEKPQLRVTISPAEPYPLTAAEAMKRVLSDFDYVTEAYIVNMTNPADGKTVYLVIINTQEKIERSAANSVFAALNKAAKESGVDREVQYAVNDNDFTKRALSGKKPFYRKKDDGSNVEVVRTSDGKKYVFDPDAMDAVDAEYAEKHEAEESENTEDTADNTESTENIESSEAAEGEAPAENNGKSKKGGLFGLFGKKQS